MKTALYNGHRAPLRVVLDSNAVLDWLHFRDAHFQPIARAIADGDIELRTCAACLAELQRVLAYPEFRLDERQAAALYASYAEATELVAVSEQDRPALPRCRDPDDQKFLELAREAGAHYLVTRDKALLRLSRGMPFAIVTPAALAAVLQSSAARRLESASSAAPAPSSMDQTTLR